jgi:hypothetical protein
LALEAAGLQNVQVKLLPLIVAVKETELLVPSYAIKLPEPNANGDTSAPMFFRSWQARGILLTDKLADKYDLNSLYRTSSSATPTYFPIRTTRNER